MESPAATAAREESAQEFRGLDAEEAANADSEEFPRLLNVPLSLAPKLVEGERISAYPTPHVAQLSLADGEHAVVESQLPMVTRAGNGSEVPIDLSLREESGEIEPLHPLVPVKLPVRLEEGFGLPQSGVGLTPLGGDGEPLKAQGEIEGAGAFYANTQADADTLAKPTPTGFETQTLLRSPASPDKLHFAISGPKGFALQQAEDGSVVVEAAEATVAAIAPVSAVDAAGTPVPVAAEVSGDELLLSVARRAGEYQYPIAVDPTVEEHNWGYFEQGPWYFTTNAPGAFVYPFTAGHPEFPTVYNAGVPYVYGQFGAWNYTTGGQSRIYQYEPSVWSGYSEDQMDNLVGIIGAGGWEAQQWLGTYVYPQLTTLQCPAGNCTETSGSAGNTAVYEKVAINGGSVAYGEAQNYAVRIAQDSVPSVGFDTTHSTIEGHLNALYPGRWVRTASEAVVPAVGTDAGIGIYKRGLSSTSDRNWYGIPYGAAPGCVGIQCEETLPFHAAVGNLPEGESTIEAVVENAAGCCGRATATVKVDNAPPTVSLSGLASGHIAGLAQNELKAVVKDGSEGTPSSGVAQESVAMWVDGERVTISGWAGCSPGPCQVTRGYSFVGRDLGVGEHTVTVEARDNAGNRVSKVFQISIVAEGPLVDLGPGQLNPANGDYLLRQQDVSPEVAGAGLSVTRSYESLQVPREASPFGPQWQLSLGGWQGVSRLADGSALFTDAKGHQILFERLADNTYKAPAKYPGWKLAYSEEAPATYTLTDASGDVTTFRQPGESGSLYLPASFSGPSGTLATTFHFYTSGAITRPTEVLGPVPAGVSCATMVRGCRALTFDYATNTTASGDGPDEWGEYSGRLDKIELHAWDPETETMAAIPVAEYAYDSHGRLRAEWDPRISPPLKTEYFYESEGRLSAVEPPGQQPWLLRYGSIPGDSHGDWLLSVSRPPASALLGAAVPPEDTAPPHFSGAASAVGTRYYVWNGTWSNEPASYRYQWERCDAEGGACAPIAGATRRSYTPAREDLGATLRVEVTATNAAGSATATTAASPVVRGAAIAFASSFGEAGSGEGQLSVPVGVADKDGHLWVADAENNRVEEFNAAGKYLGQFGEAGTGPGQLRNPYGLAVDSKGHIWVADSGNHRVEEFNASGEYLSQFGEEGSGPGQLRTPFGLAVDHEGHIWVADLENNRIEEFNEAGEYMSQFGEAGTGPGQLRYPYGLTVDREGHIWVADGGNYRVEEFNASGEYLSQFGEEGTGPGQLRTPFGLAVDPGGHIWVADGENERVEEFNEAGEYLSQFGEEGTGEGQFTLPAGIDVGPEGGVWVTDAANDRVAEWTREGPRASSLAFGEAGSGDSQFGGPIGLASDSQGHLWVPDSANNRVEEFNASGEYLSQFGAKGSGDGEFSDPLWVAADSEGDVWVSDTENDRVEEFNEAGEYLSQFGEEGTGPGQLRTPFGLAVDPGGHIWVADSGNHRVEEFNAAGEYLSQFGEEGSGKGQFGEPFGLATDPEGHIWVVDTDHNRVEEFNAAGEYLSQFGEEGSGPGQLHFPVDVAADRKGHLWVTDFENHRVQEFNEAGEYLAQFGEAGRGEGQFSFPAGIDVGPEGAVWVSDAEADRVSEWIARGPEPQPDRPPPNPATATWTVAYHIPTSGSGAPYPMASYSVARWGQTTAPSDATAIFPPDEVPDDQPPPNYRRATVYYLDGKGNIVNTAAPGGRISTEEHDAHGNVTRKVTPEDRARALAAENPPAAAGSLDTQLTYSEDGTELLGVLGPEHEVKLPSGEAVQARLHTRYSYDEGAPAEGGPYDLPTKQTEAALAGGEELDLRTKSISYDGQNGLGWELRQPTSETVDPGGLALTTRTFYDATSGDVTETRMPGNPEGGDAHAQQAIYYTAGESEVAECGDRPEWVGLLCRTQPAAQPGTLGLPALPVSTTTAYNTWNEPLTSTETVEEESRTATVAYDGAGRPVESTIAATSGTPLPAVTIEYDEESGAPTVEQAGTESLASEYNSLGQLTAYTDAGGNTSTYSYDIDGRLRELNDGKGTQLASYDPTTGDLTKIDDSGVGAFTATYDAGGKPLSVRYPDGLRATYTYSATGAATALRYVKTSDCSEDCTWYSDEVIPSIHGQTLSETSTLASQSYGFDAAGRLTKAQETPAGKGCTTRLYAYDADSNRTSTTIRGPAEGGACAGSGGATQTTAFDAADRVMGEGVTYNAFGDITELPAEDAGGSALQSTYYADGSVASMGQDGRTLEYGRDPEGRIRETVETDSTEHTEIAHFCGPGDSPVWTDDGSGEWTRYVSAFGGLAAIQSSSGTVRLQLGDLHGDIVATAPLSETASEPEFATESTEFGVPLGSQPPAKYFWFGAVQRPTELPSGVVNMGARAYVPQLGRFLQTDPAPGGSANAYAYGFGDPVDEADLSGEWTPHVPPWLIGYEENPPGMPPPPPPPPVEAEFEAEEVGGGFGSLIALPGAGGQGATASAGPVCSVSAVVTDQRLFFPFGYDVVHVVSANFSWSCTKKVTVYAWLKIGGAPTPPQPYGNSKSGVSVVPGGYTGYGWQPLLFCIKFFYAGHGKKTCSVVPVDYET